MSLRDTLSCATRTRLEEQGATHPASADVRIPSPTATSWIEERVRGGGGSRGLHEVDDDGQRGTGTVDRHDTTRDGAKRRHSPVSRRPSGV